VEEEAEVKQTNGPALSSVCAKLSMESVTQFGLNRREGEGRHDLWTSSPNSTTIWPFGHPLHLLQQRPILKRQY